MAIINIIIIRNVVKYPANVETEAHTHTQHSTAQEGVAEVALWPTIE